MARIIVLFILTGVLIIVFVVVQAWQKDRATVPPNVIKQRTVWASSIHVFFLFGSFLAFIYYLPIWLQGIKAVSATHSGIDILPCILATVVLSLLGGGLVTMFGYYTWTCILSSMLATVGIGLISTFRPETSAAEWIGYQIIYGAGCGFGLQQPFIAIQKVLPEKHVSEGTAMIIFLQNLGGAIFLPVAQ